MKKIHSDDVIAILSSVVMIGWIITGFYGGMLLWYFSYTIILTIMIILYIVSFFGTLFSITQSGYKNNNLKVLSHVAVITTIIAVNVYNSDLFKPEPILAATLYDDLYHYRLILRKEGKCEIETSGFLGFKDIYQGNYYFKGDTIIFRKLPYDNDFIPKTLLLDRNEKALFMNRDKEGRFVRKKEFLSYFRLDTLR